jgi:hypothetical protein
VDWSTADDSRVNGYCGELSKTGWQTALDLFDAFGTRDKTLHANLGGHAGVPWFEVDDGARFFARHLR